MPPGSVAPFYVQLRVFSSSNETICRPTGKGGCSSFEGGPCSLSGPLHGILSSFPLVKLKAQYSNWMLQGCRLLLGLKRGKWLNTTQTWTEPRRRILNTCLEGWKNECWNTLNVSQKAAWGGCQETNSLVQFMSDPVQPPLQKTGDFEAILAVVVCVPPVQSEWAESSMGFFKGTWLLKRKEWSFLSAVESYFYLALFFCVAPPAAAHANWSVENWSQIFN